MMPRHNSEPTYNTEFYRNLRVFTTNPDDITVFKNMFTHFLKAADYTKTSRSETDTLDTMCRYIVQVAPSTEPSVKLHKRVFEHTIAFKDNNPTFTMQLY